MPDNDLGSLAAALAKAQAEFPTIPRDKKVTVTMKNGGEYNFAYAPLDSIIAATRGPLTKNGLALTQLLDPSELVTMLLHESGAVLSARTDLPASQDIQAFGSSITYLRRYAIQAILGIAAEEDDDGNRGAGNHARSTSKTGPSDALQAPRTPQDGSLIGIAKVGTKNTSDGELRVTPEGHHMGFRLEPRDGDKGGILVEVNDPMASAMAALREDWVNQPVTCWGVIEDRGFTSPGKRPVTYQALVLSRISTPTMTLPAPDDTEAELDRALELVP